MQPTVLLDEKATENIAIMEGEVPVGLSSLFSSLDQLHLSKRQQQLTRRWLGRFKQCAAGSNSSILSLNVESEQHL